MKKKTFICFLVFAIILASVYVNNSNSIAAQKGSLIVTVKKSSFSYTGKAIKPTVTVKYDGKKLSSASYTVKYSAGCKAVGKYKITVTCKGQYKGTKTVTYSIVPAKPVITKIKVKNNSVDLVWKKSGGGASEYQIMIAKNKAFTKGKMVKTTKSVTKNIKLDYRTKYFVKVRGIKKVKGKKYISDWSIVKPFITGAKSYNNTEPTTSGKDTEDTTDTSTQDTSSTSTQDNTTAKPCEHEWVVDTKAHYEWKNKYDENGKKIIHAICMGCGLDLEEYRINNGCEYIDGEGGAIALHNEKTACKYKGNYHETYYWCSYDENGNKIDHPHKGDSVGMDTYIPDSYKCSKCNAKVYMNIYGTDEFINYYHLQKDDKNTDLTKLTWIYKDVNSKGKKTVTITINNIIYNAENYYE